MEKVELLAPAGDPEKLKVAIHYGADAVYISDRFFGLRGKAGNFRRSQMEEAVEFAHSHGVKVYIAVNLFAYNRDFRRLADYLRFLSDRVKPDALIVADPGVIDLAQEVAPDLELHLSTQANTLNQRACSFWSKQGIQRIILARELSFGDISSIASSGEVDVEIFVHGSICIAYSGRCFISNYMSSYRDANRGLCTNSCRWSYQLQEKEYRVEEQQRPGEYYPIEEDGRGTYLFNSKDLCLLPRLDEILSSPVKSLKVEGRTKSLSYLSTVISVYRRAIDAWYRDPAEFSSLLPNLQVELNQLGSRGYTEGLFKGHEREQYNLFGAQRQQSFDFAGLVKAKREIKGQMLSLVSIKKKLVKGDLVQVYEPHHQHREEQVLGIYDENGLALKKAIPGQEVYLKGIESVAENTILRLPV